MQMRLIIYLNCNCCLYGGTHSLLHDKLQCLFKLVNMANTIFSKLEKKLKKFDVQQMHSNGELASEFMVMSGIPNKNGMQIF